jgi:hypothetical protein
LSLDVLGAELGGEGTGYLSGGSALAAAFLKEKPSRLIGATTLGLATLSVMTPCILTFNITRHCIMTMSVEALSITTLRIMVNCTITLHIITFSLLTFSTSMLYMMTLIIATL